MLVRTVSVIVGLKLSRNMII